MQTKLVLKRPAALKLRFQPGATGPSGTLAVGTVTTGAPGSSVIIENVGTPTAAILDITIPRGDVGATGNKGWSPILAIVTDGARRVLQVSDWTGGEGTKPASGSYIGPTGLVAAIGDAVDIRGAQGPAGSVSDGDKGDISVSGSGAAWTIDNDVVTDAKLRNSAGLSVIGRSSNTTGDPADIVAGTDGFVLRRSGTTVDFGQVATAGITDKAVTLAKQADVSTSVIMGRATAGTGSQETLTGGLALGIITASSGAVSGFRNLLHNGTFLVNQRGYAGAALTAGSFGFDRWKADTGGATYSVSGRVMTISAGTVVQVVDGADILISGTYVINWTGTATCTVDGVAKTKGATFTLTAGTNCTVKFTGGTVSFPQIEPGNVPTAFEVRSSTVEMLLCRGFYQVVQWQIAAVATAGSQDIYGTVNFQPMRATPSVVKSSGSFANCSLVNAPTLNPSFLADFARSAGAGTIYAGYSALLSADL